MKTFLILGVFFLSMTSIARADEISDDLPLKNLGEATMSFTNKTIRANSDGLWMVLEKDESTKKALTYCSLKYKNARPDAHPKRGTLNRAVNLNGITGSYTSERMIDLQVENQDQSFSRVVCAVGENSKYQLNAKLLKDALASVGAILSQAHAVEVSAGNIPVQTEVNGAGVF